jgi:hypothetical protein
VFEAGGCGNDNRTNYRKIPLSSNPQFYSLRIKLWCPSWDSTSFLIYLNKFTHKSHKWYLVYSILMIFPKYRLNMIINLQTPELS